MRGGVSRLHFFRYILDHLMQDACAGWVVLLVNAGVFWWVRALVCGLVRVCFSVDDEGTRTQVLTVEPEARTLGDNKGTLEQEKHSMTLKRPFDTRVPTRNRLSKVMLFVH